VGVLHSGVVSVHTYGSALALVGVRVPGHLDGGAWVPVLTGPQAQGDLLVVPNLGAGRLSAGERSGLVRGWEVVSPAGVRVVRGEATGNTHWLHGGFDSPGVRWLPINEGLVYGYVLVPAGETALLIHTDEHGANGIGPGTYAIRGKRELGRAARLVERRVLD
jgi:hypothetical protein